MKNIELNALPVHDDRYINTKIGPYSDKVYTTFRGLNVPGDDIECRSFTVISIYSLLIYRNKSFLQVYLDNCTYKIANKQVTEYLDDNLSEKTRYWKWRITRELIYVKELILLKVIEVNNAWFSPIGFFYYGFKFQDSVCNSCHDLTMISDMAVITIKILIITVAFVRLAYFKQLIY